MKLTTIRNSLIVLGLLVFSTQPALAAAAAFVDCGSHQTNTALAGTYAVTVSATVAAGDLLIGMCNATNNEHDQGCTMDGAAGFTAFAGNLYGGDIDPNLALFYKVAAGTEDGASINFTGSGGGTLDLFQARICRFSAPTGGFAAVPVISINTNTGVESPLSPANCAITGTDQLCVNIAAINTNDATIGSFTGESAGDWTEVTFVATSVGDDGTVKIDTAPATVTGGTIAFDESADTTPEWVSVSFVLTPEQATSGGQKARRPIEF